MKPLNYVLADVFTNRRFGGNQLAVFPQVNDLSTELMQMIARELNLSETVFVFPPGSPDLSFSIRIFTPSYCPSLVTPRSVPRSCSKPLAR